MNDWLLQVGGTVLVVLWEILSTVVVPIAAAGIAAWVVVRQIRQLNRHRDEDRIAQAIIELTAVLIGEVASGENEESYRNAERTRWRNNEHLIRAYALMPKRYTAVARWVATVRSGIQAHIKEAWDTGEIGAVDVYAARGKASKSAADAMESMLEWQRGGLRLKWFKDRL